jgi:hypothetical protein
VPWGAPPAPAGGDSAEDSAAPVDTGGVDDAADDGDTGGVEDTADDLDTGLEDTGGAEDTADDGDTGGVEDTADVGGTGAEDTADVGDTGGEDTGGVEDTGDVEYTDPAEPPDPSPELGPALHAFAYAMGGPPCGDNWIWTATPTLSAPVRVDRPDLLGTCPDRLPPEVDGDRDGLPDAWEPRLATSGGVADTDRDGLGDGFDWVLGYPHLADVDRDGLLDSGEAAFGSEATVVDTDCDGAPDGADVAHGSSPRVADTDGDGHLDGQEIAAGWSPLSTGAGRDDAPVDHPVWVAQSRWSDVSTGEFHGRLPVRIEDVGPAAQEAGRAVRMRSRSFESDAPLDAPAVGLYGPGWDGSWERLGRWTTALGGRTADVVPVPGERPVLGGVELDTASLLRDLGPIDVATRSAPEPAAACADPLVGAWTSAAGDLLFATLPDGSLRVALRSDVAGVPDLHLRCGDVRQPWADPWDHWSDDHTGRRVLCTEPDRQPSDLNETNRSWVIDLYDLRWSNVAGTVCEEFQSEWHYQAPSAGCGVKVAFTATRVQ